MTGIRGAAIPGEQQRMCSAGVQLAVTRSQRILRVGPPHERPTSQRAPVPALPTATIEATR
jgi:hypothetical protein